MENISDHINYNVKYECIKWSNQKTEIVRLEKRTLFNSMLPTGHRTKCKDTNRLKIDW